MISAVKTVCASISLLVFVAFSLPATNNMNAMDVNTMDLSVDHVTICERDLSRMQSAFTSMGLPTDYGGKHSNGTTHMALLGFDDGSYIELIAPINVQDQGWRQHNWAKYMEADAGACAWAIGAGDVSAEAARLSSLGFQVSKPVNGKRQKPDGTLVEWDSAYIGKTPGAVLPFFIKDRTSRGNRVQSSKVTAHTEMRGIKAVVIAVNNLDASIASFRKAYSLPAPLIESNREFNARMAYFEGTPIMLASPAQQDAWLGNRLQQIGEAPVAFLIGSSKFEHTIGRFKLQAAEHWFGKNVAWIDPANMNGIRLGIIDESSRK